MMSILLDLTWWEISLVLLMWISGSVWLAEKLFWVTVLIFSDHEHQHGDEMLEKLESGEWKRGD